MADQFEELFPGTVILEIVPYPKTVLRRCGLRGVTRPRVLRVGRIGRQRRRQAFDAFGQQDTFPDQMLPTFVPTCIAKQLLGSPIGREASEETDERSVRIR